MRPRAAPARSGGQVLLGLLLPLSQLAAQAPRIRVDTIGDTVVVTNLASRLDAVLPVARPAAPVPLWGRDSLVRPTGMARLPDGRLVVADAPRLYVLSAEAALLKVVGRQGSGPGEFHAIEGVASAGGDTILVWDGNQRRLTWLLASSGRVVRTLSVSAPPGRATAQVLQLRRLGSATIVAWASGAIQPGGPPDEVVLSRVSLGGGPTGEVGRVIDVAWTPRQASGWVGPVDPFGPRALYAVSPAGEVATASGVAYCVNVKRVSARSVRRVCREWTRRPVGSAANVPRGLEPEQAGRALPGLVAAQRPSAYWHAIDELSYGADGTLWVRVVDSTSTVHPFYAQRVRRLRPLTYLWEGFASDGRLARRVAVSSDFRPLWFDTVTVYGVLEGANGEVSIARIDLQGRPSGSGRPER